MEIKVFESKKELGKGAAKYFIDLVNQKSDAVLGLATGSSPENTYLELINAYKENKVSFANVKTYNLDEYVGLDTNHPQSYYTFMQENLFKHIDIKQENINLPSGIGDTQLNCQLYNDKLAQTEIDMQLLGIGSNGHIAFNEPGTAFDSITHCIELQKNTVADNARFFDNDLTKVPTHALTMGLSNIMQAKQIVLIAYGKNKAQAIYEMVKGPITEALPASILQNHPNVVVLLDEEAAALLND